jgi:hypothetical protein
MRRDDHRAVRTLIKRDRWNRETEREEDEEYQRVKKASKARLIDMCFAPMHNQTMAEAFGGGEHGKKWRKCSTASNLICRWTIWLTRNFPARPILMKSNQSNQIRLNPT